MINSRLADLVRSHPALFVASVLTLIFLLGLASGLRPKAKALTPIFTNIPPGEATTYPRDPGPLVVNTKPPPLTQGNTNPPFTGVSIHTAAPADTNPPPLGVYAPAGRLLRCQLVNTVDSANINTPIIALVTDDLWHDGQIVIPAGSEVHGKASVDRMRERVVASGSWIIVWQTGEELTVEGTALDREESFSGAGWGLTDGSAGLRGQILQSDSYAEAKLFIATFMSAAAAGLQENRSTVFGSQIANTGRNAALAGSSQIMNTYAQQMLETIRRDGIFVRVPAGKQLYLYIDHTLDRSQAKRGNLRVTALPHAPNSHDSNNITIHGR